MTGVMLSVFLTWLVVVNGQDCLRVNNPNGLPQFMDYRGSELSSETIPELHQAIIPSYRFTCCGNITEWGVDVHPGGKGHDGFYSLNLQVWRPTPTVETTGCYSLVGNNQFTSVLLNNQVAIVTPLPQAQIKFQPGDVLGFIMENTDRDDGGVVLLIDSSEQDDNGYEIEEVWHADVSNDVVSNRECPYPVGTGPGRILNTRASAAPVVSISYATTACLPNIAPTICPEPSQPTVMENSQSDPSGTDSSDSVVDQKKTEETLLNHNHSNIGLIIGVVVAALMVVTIVILTLALGFFKRMKGHKNEVPMATNEAYGTGLQDKTSTESTEGDTYDYPGMEDQAKRSIDAKQNEAYATSAETKLCIAYATNAEAKPCVAYTTNITTERNDAYGSRLQEMVLYREGYTYDYPTMDN